MTEFRTRTKVYYPASTTHEGSGCVSVEIDQATGTSVAQVSAITPDTHLGADPGYLIRVWPVGGTHEHGGDNGTFLSVIVQFHDDGSPYLKKIVAAS